MSLTITDANFEELVLKSEVPVLVDFWAEWCAPCQMILPIIDAIATEYEGRAVVGKMSVEENSEIPVKYGIRNIPALLYFVNGEVVDKQIGATSKSVLTGKLDKTLE